ncbi:hypothetical protein CEXT_351671 [Caerostris extrusa]|uniref:Uncharacterized protein n=1 Tax=Caerostris extrusa TaxID=172846 RepID=A0AAV4V812_CAEEX|nr:hypothetical protein CEXT_351671 [Caerostris extrusa]
MGDGSMVETPEFDLELVRLHARRAGSRSSSPLMRLLQEMSALHANRRCAIYCVFRHGKRQHFMGWQFRRGEREREWPVIKCPTEQIKLGGRSDNKDGSPLSIRKQLDSLGGKAKEEEAWLARWILKW